MARTTRASYELIRDERTDRALWLDWLASADPKFRNGDNEPIIDRIAKAGGLSDKTLRPFAKGVRTPTLETLGELVAAGAYLNGVSEDEAHKHIVRLVHRPIAQDEAA